MINISYLPPIKIYRRGTDMIVAHIRNRVSSSEIRYQALVYSGDTQAVGTGGLCGLALPATPIYRTRQEKARHEKYIGSYTLLARLL